MAMGAIGQPSARSHLAHALVRSRVAPLAEPWITDPAGMTPVLNRLRDAGLAREVNGFWTLTPGAFETVCRRAQRKGLLKPLAAAGQASYDSGKLLLDGLGRDLAAFRLAFLEGRPEDRSPPDAATKHRAGEGGYAHARMHAHAHTHAMWRVYAYCSRPGQYYLQNYLQYYQQYY